MTPESVQMLFALVFGFAVAGMCSSGYRLVTDRLPSFTQLSNGPAVPDPTQHGPRSATGRAPF